MRICNSKVQAVALFMLLAMASLVSIAALPAYQLKFDTDPLDSNAQNPYSMSISMNSWTNPILDHTGKPHKHGHIIQLIADGGNGVQDPPRADGTPGGDDSLAYGNFNLMRLVGLNDGDPAEAKASSGMFYSHLYFIPYVVGKAYYLRLWEGEDYATAPYYQDSQEYVAGQERGGAMIVMKSGMPPLDLDWKFGPSKPRPAK